MKGYSLGGGLFLIVLNLDIVGNPTFHLQLVVYEEQLLNFE